MHIHVYVILLKFIYVKFIRESENSWYKSIVAFECLGPNQKKLLPMCAQSHISFSILCGFVYMIFGQPLSGCWCQLHPPRSVEQSWQYVLFLVATALTMVRTRHQQQSLAAATATASAAQELEEDGEEGTAEDTPDQTEDDGYPEQGSAADFIIVGAEILNRAAPLTTTMGGCHHRRSRAFNERWTAHFHVEPEVCEDVWKRLDITEFDGIEEEGEPCHLLWAFLFLKTYATLSVLSSMCGGVDEDTISKWVWIFVSKISYLENDVVSLF